MNVESTGNKVFNKEFVDSKEKMGLRLVGLYANHTPAIAISEAFADPEYRWSTTTLLDDESKRYSLPNMAIITGPTYVTDDSGNRYQYILNVFDNDCPEMYNHFSTSINQILSDSSWDWVTDKVRILVKEFLAEEGIVNNDYNKSLLDVIKQSGYVTKTMKEYGFHVPYLDPNQHPVIKSRNCNEGKEFEIHTGKHLCTLPGSSYRPPKLGEENPNYDPNFRYTQIGLDNRVIISSVFYDLICAIGETECLLNNNKDSKLDVILSRNDNNNNNHNDNNNSNKNNNDSGSGSSSDLSNELKDMTTLLMMNDSVVIPERHRHTTLVSVANSILFKHSETKGNAELKSFFMQINKQCCRPTPQPDSDVEQIWKDATEYVSNSKSKKKKITPEDIAFVIKTMKKEAPHDEISIKQLFYGMSSAFTKLPIHHNVNSRKSGAGKTYDLTLTAGFFPNKYVLPLAGVSDKGFIHEEGLQVIVNEDTGETTPIAPFVKELELKIEGLKEQMDDPNLKIQKKEFRKQIKDYESQIKELYSKSQKLIILDNRIVLVLDTAQEGLISTLMSIISQDTPRDQLYQFTDKKGFGRLGATKNRFRGTPCMFTTQVIDDTRQIRYQEKNRRFIHVTPNTSREKIHSATNLIGQKYGLLPEEYDESVVSRKDKERAKEIVSILVSKLIEHSKKLNPKESGIKIPFFESIVHCLNSRAGEGTNEWIMTIMDRMMRYLTIITKINMDSRPKIIDTQTGVFYPIAIFDDLKEALQLMGMASSAIRPYIANWYNKAFLQAFNTLEGKPRVDRDAFGNVIASEIEPGLTTQDLAEATKEYMHVPKPSRDEVIRDYVYPLLNQGIINKSKSVINGKEIILSPAEEGKIFSMFAGENEDGKDSSLKLEINDTKLYPGKNVIEESYVFLSK